MSDSVLAPVRAPFRALTVTFVPEAKELDEGSWAEVESLVEGMLDHRPRAVRRQVRLLLRALDLFSLLRFGRRLSALEADARHRIVSRLQDSPILILRRGVWGLRTLAFLGIYGRATASREIGYRADRRGWEARRTGRKLS